MELCNTVVISGVVKKIYPIHYSPFGVCVHRFVLEHKSELMDNNVRRQVNLSLFCLILDVKESQIRQTTEGSLVKLKGYLSQNMKAQIVMHVALVENLKKE